jgi:probable rRNA maturation factor
LAVPLLPGALPGELSEIHFVLVDRATMIRVHGDFLGDATETDVITFPYGEILVCPAVARDRTAELRVVLEEEILLYGLHGLLHLAGYDDVEPEQAGKMARAQRKLLKEILKERL